MPPQWKVNNQKSEVELRDGDTIEITVNGEVEMKFEMASDGKLDLYLKGRITT